jgi:hypothetical protein
VSVYSAVAGKVTAVHGLDELTALPEVHSVLALVEPGDVIGEGYAIHAVNVLVKGMVEHAEVAACQRRITPFVTIDVEPVR